jgi:hypothetical protein
VNRKSESLEKITAAKNDSSQERWTPCACRPDRAELSCHDEGVQMMNSKGDVYADVLQEVAGIEPLPKRASEISATQQIALQFFSAYENHLNRIGLIPLSL